MPPKKRVATEASKRAVAVAGWESVGSVFVKCFGDVRPGTRVLSFDFDDTLVTTKSGKTFAANCDDWKYLFGDGMKETLATCLGEYDKLVVFSNQAGMTKGKDLDVSKKNDILARLEAFAVDLGLPLQIFVSSAKDEFRKPNPNMWDLMVEKYNGGAVPVLEKCLFVGDAAGRPAVPGVRKGKKDFSCSDRKFALNVHIPFKTPEEFFLNGTPEPFELDAPALDSLPKKSEGAVMCEELGDNFVAVGQEMVILVGFPASGKSTFCSKYLAPRGYVVVNRDTLKTPAKCMSACQAALAAGRSVVIDNTNPSKAARKAFIDAAKARNVPVRCFRFDVPEDMAVHLNYFRERVDPKSPHVPQVGYNMYKKNFEEPVLSEGFASIHHLKFVLDDFASKDAEKSFFILS